MAETKSDVSGDTPLSGVSNVTRRLAQMAAAERSFAELADVVQHAQDYAKPRQIGADRRTGGTHRS